MFIAEILGYLINLYIFVIIIHVCVTWLVAFRVLDAGNEQTRNLISLLQRATDPVIKPVQKYVPPIGGIDLSPIVVIVGLQLLVHLLMRLFLAVLY